MMHRIAALVCLSCLTAATACAQQAPPPPPVEQGAAQLAIVTLPAKDGAKLTVSSPAFVAGGDIPLENTQYRTNTFPGLAWTAGPAATKSYVVIMHDGDAGRNGVPLLHWSMANIPVSMLKLEAGMTAPPAGAMHGPNIRGANQPYMGPRTPAGPKHRYHFQVFALDITLADTALATYADLVAAMKDHVLASGEVIGLGHAPN
jgi:para-nitrobenzyl esterase